MKYYEKLLILIVLFLGVTIGTAGIIGVYNSKKNNRPNNNNNNSNTIILENINRF